MRFMYRKSNRSKEKAARQGAAIFVLGG